MAEGQDVVRECTRGAVIERERHAHLDDVELGWDSAQCAELVETCGVDQNQCIGGRDTALQLSRPVAREAAAEDAHRCAHTDRPARWDQLTDAHQVEVILLEQRVAEERRLGVHAILQHQKIPLHRHRRRRRRATHQRCAHRVQFRVHWRRRVRHVEHRPCIWLPMAQPARQRRDDEAFANHVDRDRRCRRCTSNLDGVDLRIVCRIADCARREALPIDGDAHRVASDISACRVRKARLVAHCMRRVGDESTSADPARGYRAASAGTETAHWRHAQIEKGAGESDGRHQVVSAASWEERRNRDGRRVVHDQRREHGTEARRLRVEVSTHCQSTASDSRRRSRGASDVSVIDDGGRRPHNTSVTEATLWCAARRGRLKRGEGVETRTDDGDDTRTADRCSTRERGVVTDYVSADVREEQI